MSRRVRAEGGGLVAKKRSMALVFVVIGVGAIATGIIAFTTGEATTGWPNVVGDVVATEIAARPGKDANGRSVTMHEPSITYAYAVAGKRYTARRIKVVRSSYKSESTAQKVIATHPVGSKVTVFYDPEDPESAVLETGGSLAFTFGATIGGLVLLVFAYMEITAGKRAERAAAEATERRRAEKAKEPLGQNEDAVPPPDIATLKAEAEKAVAAGKLGKAAKRYRALLLCDLDAATEIDEATVLYRLADVEHRRGKEQKAIRLLERTLEIDPGHAEARALLAELVGH